METKLTREELFVEIQKAMQIVKRYEDALLPTKYTDEYVACHELYMKFARLIEKSYSDNDYKVYLAMRMKDINPKDITNSIHVFYKFTEKQVIEDRTKLRDICLCIMNF